jgi:hypothetical protein
MFESFKPLSNIHIHAMNVTTAPTEEETFPKTGVPYWPHEIKEFERAIPGADRFVWVDSSEFKGAKVLASVPGDFAMPEHDIREELHRTKENLKEVVRFALCRNHSERLREVADQCGIDISDIPRPSLQLMPPTPAELQRQQEAKKLKVIIIGSNHNVYDTVRRHFSADRTVVVSEMENAPQRIKQISNSPNTLVLVGNQVKRGDTESMNSRNVHWKHVGGHGAPSFIGAINEALVRHLSSSK